MATVTEAELRIENRKISTTEVGLLFGVTFPVAKKLLLAAERDGLIRCERIPGCRRRYLLWEVTALARRHNDLGVE